jgi:hypothetical protein
MKSDGVDDFGSILIKVPSDFIKKNQSYSSDLIRKGGEKQI